MHNSGASVAFKTWWEHQDMVGIIYPSLFGLRLLSKLGGDQSPCPQARLYIIERVNLWLTELFHIKVENISRRLDPITFAFCENSNYWQESLFEVIRQILMGDVNKLFVFKSLLTTPSNVLPLKLK